MSTDHVASGDTNFESPDLASPDLASPDQVPSSASCDSDDSGVTGRSSERIASMDISTGASGDKVVCSLMDACEKLGVYDRKRFEELFAELLPDAKVVFEERKSGGICGLGMKVVAADYGGDNCGYEHSHEHEHTHEHGHGHEYVHENAHEHGNHSHEHVHEHDDHSHEHEYGNASPHGHRLWSSIRASIESWASDGRITRGACERALRAFELVAQAESQVHGVPVEDVAFHEVGAIDSIVDIVGASVLFDALACEEVHSSIVVTGFGTVRCAHGTLPVPAPATASICEGIPIESGAYEGEMTTPTGAALLKANITRWEPMPAIVPLAIGTGLGTRRIEGTSNSLRTIVGNRIDRTLSSEGCSTASSIPMTVETCILLQTNIDHISPENAATCCEELLAAGALDVWQQSITMKKGRLGCLLGILARPCDADRLSSLACKLTGSLGIRRSVVERSVAPRESQVIDTPYGEVRFKLAWPGEPSRRTCWTRPEHDDVARIARQTDMSPEEVERDLVRIWLEQNGQRL